MSLWTWPNADGRSSPQRKIWEHAAAFCNSSINKAAPHQAAPQQWLTNERSVMSGLLSSALRAKRRSWTSHWADTKDAVLSSSYHFSLITNPLCPLGVLSRQPLWPAAHRWSNSSPLWHLGYSLKMTEERGFGFSDVITSSITSTQEMLLKYPLLF